MLFMNTYEIDEAVERFRDHSTLSAATRTLANLRDAANANSDGWAYWPKPCRAAKKLQELIMGNGTAFFLTPERRYVTPADLKAAYAPLKAFRTRTGIQFEIVEVK